MDERSLGIAASPCDATTTHNKGAVIGPYQARLGRLWEGPNGFQ